MSESTRVETAKLLVMINNGKATKTGIVDWKFAAGSGVDDREVASLAGANGFGTFRVDMIVSSVGLAAAAECGGG